MNKPTYTCATKGCGAEIAELRAEVERLKGVVRDYCEPNEGWRHAIATISDARHKALNDFGRAMLDVATLSAENAELRREISEHVLRADSLRAELSRLEEELELEQSEAVSEAVERATKVIDELEIDCPNCEVYGQEGEYIESCAVHQAMRDAIDILLSRDWSKGEGE